MIFQRPALSSLLIIGLVNIINLNLIECLSPPSLRSDRISFNSQKMRKEMENMYVECTGALNNWSYIVRKSVKLLVSDNNNKSDVIIDTIYEIGSQLLLIENSFLICKSELEMNGVKVVDISEKIDLEEIYNQLKLNNMNNEALESIYKVENLKDRIKLLKSQYEFLKEIKTGILKFEPKDVCYKCNIFRAQLSLIGILNKLGLIYDKYIQELEDKIENLIFESEVATESEIYDSDSTSPLISVQLHDLD
ncbi:hypothetical protein FG379_001922 [Cryptosporidium bovis]|uniref:uncharacterized protein n=1 Tax=Cryptosporidium bovis TaxID=310047 RepID=UPI003519F8CC|nr:hypothetical protein FG379_001922 [Cryptosporidium bovis]